MMRLPLHRIFFLLLVLFLPTQLGLHVWPEWSYILGRRVDYLSPTLYFTDLLWLLLIASWLSVSFKNFKDIKINVAVLIAALLFAFTNIWLSQAPMTAAYQWIKIGEFLLLGFYIKHTKPSITLFMPVLTTAVLVSSLLAMWQFFFGHSVGGIFWWLGERTFSVLTPGIARITLCSPISDSCALALRPYATFPHSNVLGGFLAIALPLIWTQWSRYPLSHPPGSVFRRVVPYGIRAAVVLGSMALVLTFSRSAWLGCLISVLPLMARLRKNSTWFVLLAVALGGVLVLSTVKFAQESVVVRQQLQMVSLMLWQQSPLVGIGAGNFIVALPDLLVSKTVYYLQPVHNLYLLTLSEYGLIGLGGLLWLLFSGIKKFSFRCSPLLALVVIGVFDHYLLTLQQGQLLLTLVVGLSLVNPSHDTIAA
jgi:O-antigen ligase